MVGQGRRGWTRKERRGRTHVRVRWHRVAFGMHFDEQHDHVIEISGASGTVELRATAVLLVILAGSVALRLDDGVEPFHHAPLGMMVARALALGGLVGVDVDRPIVYLDFHHGVHRISAVTLVARRRRRAGRTRSTGDS
ncbi:uncharacterized protein LOC112639368 [Camponotus floridanus]|uniref:uncharacterized protein LOC112639368 n=1 Tax=Camponotus floridanus TaxID=104421 RepID=UPI000DC6716C|nr:uncharacterized protein LOC112639368 [Camponotus floridanus]